MKYILSVFLLLITLFVAFHIPSFAKNHKPSTIIIVIDPGHGGVDPGKVSKTGVEEKDINLEIAFYLKEYLSSQDFVVYMTREDDSGLYEESASNKKTSDLNNRIRFMKTHDADCFVSIHQNSYPDETISSAQVFYNGEGTELAEYIQSSLLSVDPQNHRAAKFSSDYFLLKNATIPSVIVECGFLSNPTEASKLTDDSYQKQLAYAICIGICQYFSKNK